MKIVITGSSGFIATNLVTFLSSNHTVIGLDKLKGANTSLQIDCKTKKLISEINWEDIDLVIDCAARTDLNGESINDYNDNYLVIENLINICNTHKIKLIGFSSMLVNQLPLKKIIDFNYYNPTTLYGESKVLYEKKIKNKSKSYIIVRPTSIWGPGFKEPYKLFFDYVIKDKFFVADNSVIKTYCYIENLNEQINVLIDNYNDYEYTQQYFIDGHYNIYDWAKLIKSKSNKNGKNKILIIPRFVFYTICSLGNLVKIFVKNFPLTTFRYKNMNMNNIIELKYSVFDKQKNKYKINFGVEKTLQYIKNL
jgi:dTDP-4-dehydrorhamnose reductase